MIIWAFLTSLYSLQISIEATKSQTSDTVHFKTLGSAFNSILAFLLLTGGDRSKASFKGRFLLSTFAGCKKFEFRAKLSKAWVEWRSNPGKPGGKPGGRWFFPLLGSVKLEKNGNGDGKPKRGWAATEVGGGATGGGGPILDLKGWNGDSALDEILPFLKRKLWF